MGTLVTYQVDDGIATITMDDGKVNVLSPSMLTEIGEALDHAVADRAVALLEGREGIFSAGFDLNVLRAGGPDAGAMVRAGFDLAVRMLSLPVPLVIACTGHAVAMGVFLLLSGDYRVGASGSFRLTANEVAIGIPMPHAAVEICRHRLTPAAFNRAIILAETFDPEAAVQAGILDTVVDAGHVREAAHTTAAGLSKLDLTAHAESKRRTRAAALDAIRAGIDADRS
jgi:enoyl-CoA hydratase